MYSRYLAVTAHMHACLSCCRRFYFEEAERQKIGHEAIAPRYIIASEARLQAKVNLPSACSICKPVGCCTVSFTLAEPVNCKEMFAGRQENGTRLVLGGCGLCLKMSCTQKLVIRLKTKKYHRCSTKVACNNHSSLAIYIKLLAICLWPLSFRR